MTHSLTLPLGHAETEEDGVVLSCLVGLSSLVSCWSLLSRVLLVTDVSCLISCWSLSHVLSCSERCWSFEQRRSRKEEQTCSCHAESSLATRGLRKERRVFAEALGCPREGLRLWYAGMWLPSPTGMRACGYLVALALCPCGYLVALCPYVPSAGGACVVRWSGSVLLCVSPLLLCSSVSAPLLPTVLP